MSNKRGDQNKRADQRYFLNLTKRVSEFFKETLIIFLLLLDVREQLLIRKKKAFLLFKIAHVTKMSHNDLFLN